MKSINKGGLIADNQFKIANVDFLPGKTKFGNYDVSDYILAKLLVQLTSLYTFLNHFREELGISNNLVAFDSKAQFESLENSLDTFSKQKKQLLKERADLTMRRFPLTRNWHFSIQYLIVSNTLLVPPPEIPINYYVPIYKGERTKDADEIENLKNYPALFFTSRVTINELKTWINKNKATIRNILDDLPRKKSFRIKDSTLYWGQVAVMLKQLGTHSWTEMATKIENLSKNYYEKFPDKVATGSLYEDGYPGPNELKKYYNRYINKLKNIDFGRKPSKSDD